MLGGRQWWLALITKGEVWEDIEGLFTVEHVNYFAVDLLARLARLGRTAIPFVGSLMARAGHVVDLGFGTWLNIHTRVQCP